jgi:hypothetical protein
MGPIPAGDLVGMRNRAASRAFTEPLHQFGTNNQIADIAQPFDRFASVGAAFRDPLDASGGHEEAYSAMLDSDLASEDIAFRSEENIGGERAIVFDTNTAGNFEDDEIGIYYPESGDTEYMYPQEYEDLMNPPTQDTGYSDTGDTGDTGGY